MSRVLVMLGTGTCVDDVNVRRKGECKQMTMEYFLLLLMIVSVMTGLFTEAIKKLLDELQVGYCSNVLAGIVAVILACVVDAGYVIMIDAVLNSKMAVILIALVLLSWLIAMVGYDKVIQAISQFRTYRS